MRSSAAIKTFNTLLILLGLALILVSYPKLFLNSSDSHAASSPAIGKIISVENDARLKKSFLFNWNDSSSGDQIHNNDLIFTNEQSEAIFELSKGQQVSLKSQTLLKLKDQSLEIKNGEVALSLTDSSKDLVLIMGGQEFTLRSSEASEVTVSSEQGENKFQVSKGEVLIKAQNINVTAKAGEEVRAWAARTSKARSQINLLYPKDQTLMLAQDDEIRFQAENAPQAARVQIKNLSTGETIERPLTETATLPSGEYEWTLSLDGESVSHPAIFSVVQALAPPEQLRPTPLEEIVFYDDSVQVEFSWTQGPGILRVKDEFENSYFSEQVDSASESVEFFREGVYSWEVKSKTRLAESPWSSSRKLIVRKMDYQEGSPIVIELKRPNQLAEFNWEGGPEAGASFKLSKTRDFKNIAHQEEISGKNSVKVNIKDIGVYYWRIEGPNGPAALRPTKVLIRPTPPPGKPQAPPSLEFKLRPKKRSASAFSFFPSAYAESFEEITVAFDPIEEAKVYEIEIYSDQRQQRLVKTLKSEKPSFNWTPPRIGSYTWRIRFQDHWGRWSPFSDPSQLSASVDSRFIKKPKKPKKKVAPIVKKKKKKTLPPPPKIVRKIEPKPKKEYTNSFTGYYAPASVTYENTKEQTIEVEGVAVGGHGFEYLRRSETPLSINYQSNYGKVFEEEEFSSRSLELGLARKFKGISFGASALYRDISGYEVENDAVIASERISAIGLGISLRTQINIGAPNPLVLVASAHTLQVNQTAISLSYDYPLKKRLSLETKLRGELFSIKDEESEINSQSFQAFIGPKYLF